MRLQFRSSLTDLTSKNSSFDQGVLQIAYHGDNRNGSTISKSSFERAIPSMYNCPIVCNYSREDDSIGAHDVELVHSENGGMKLVNVTEPVGVVPESSHWFWQMVEEDDGSYHEYLCADVLLWKRQEAYQKIKENGITEHSMEIDVLNGGTRGGKYAVDDFQFTAFCLLGDAEPCYESSALLMFSKEDRDKYEADFAAMMSDLKKEFSLAQHSEEPVVDPAPEGDCTYKESTEGGKQKLDNFALAGQLIEQICAALGTEKMETSFGQMDRYIYVDHDPDANEVYCYDGQDWNLYGFGYSMNGDNVVIDFGCKKRKKCSIVDFDEGEQSFSFSKIFDIAESAFNHQKEEKAELEEKFNKASEEIGAMTEELAELRKFKADTANEEVFAKFEDLAGIEAFEALKQDCGGMDAVALEEKCFAIRGRNADNLKFALEPKPVKLPVEPAPQVVEDEPYGGIFKKFNKNI